MEEACSRLEYAARNRLFAVITGDVGTGKTTTIRKFVGTLDSSDIMRKAFDPQKGILTDTSLPIAEREALSQLIFWSNWFI